MAFCLSPLTIWGAKPHCGERKNLYLLYILSKIIKFATRITNYLK